MIRYETDESSARIVLDTPEHSNGFTYQLMNDFIAALEAARQARAPVLVLQATGKDFTLGRDQGEKLSGVSRSDSLKLILRANEALRRFPGVSVALIQGRCMGFGTGLALHADISIGADTAVLGFDEIKHGLAPLVVQTYLADHVGPKLAKELIVTGRDVPAAEAARIGLLNRVVAADQLAEEGRTLVAEFADFSAGALRLIHRFGEDLGGIEDGHAGEAAINRLVGWIEAGKPSLEP